MPDEQKCARCGTPLSANVLGGLCPACLLQQGAAPDSAPALPFEPPSIAEVAQLFPQLEVLSLIGKGGMGAVYKARQKRLDRLVALKILPPGVGRDPSFADRFEREAKALAKLHHPHIVTLYEFGTASVPQPSTLATQPLYYFLMEFVDGVNLRQLLQAGRLAPKEALAIVPQICEALQYAHDRGIVHRDIKPENILLGKDGQVKIADFGVAKIVSRTGIRPVPSEVDTVETTGKPSPTRRGHANPVPQLTEADRVVGTPQYMAPEQREHPGAVDHRADIYSLGVVFYQMLTGELPTGKFEPPSRKVQIDVRLDEVVLRALEKQPARRYQQVSEVKTLVETIATTPLEGRVPSRPPGRQFWWLRLPFLVRLAILTICAALFWFLEMRFVLPLVSRVTGLPSVVGFHLLMAIIFGWFLVAEIRKPKETRRRWAMAVYTCYLALVVVVDIGGVGKAHSQSPVGVWVPAQLDESAGERFTGLPLWVTGVTQHKQIVVVDIVCKFESPPPKLGVQFAGSLILYPAGLTQEVSDVDYFIEPEGYLNLPGPQCSKGKMTYRLGFILPDEATAAMVVEQIRRYHIGKPRGLTLENYSLELFDLERNSGRNAQGQPVHENLFAALIWPPPGVTANADNFPVGRLAFVTSPAATIPGEICVVPRNGTQQKRIQGNDPYFMPDGNHILYIRRESMQWKGDPPEEPESGIYSYDVVKEATTPLLSDPNGSCEQPSCSPDGKMIAYVLWSKDRKTSQICTANIDGTGRRRLTGGPFYNWTPQWSPDGKKIVFESTRGGDRAIYSMDFNGENTTNLSRGLSLGHFPSWSPEGLHIAYSARNEKGVANIFVMNADGSEKRNLSQSTTRDTGPVWSPDGHWIAFSRMTTNPPCPETMNVWIMRSDGTGQQPLTHNESGIWSQELTWGRTPRSPTLSK